MASTSSWKYYKDLKDMSRVRAIAASLFNTRNTGECPRPVSAAQAYATLKRVSFADGFCRADIGWREIARERASN